MSEQKPDWADEKAWEIVNALVEVNESYIFTSSLESNIANALRAEREEAERRGAVRELRKAAIYFKPGAVLLNMWANELEHKPPQREGSDGL